MRKAFLAFFLALIGVNALVRGTIGSLQAQEPIVFFAEQYHMPPVASVTYFHDTERKFYARLDIFLPSPGGGMIGMFLLYCSARDLALNYGFDRYSFLVSPFEEELNSVAMTVLFLAPGESAAEVFGEEVLQEVGGFFRVDDPDIHAGCGK